MNRRHLLALPKIALFATTANAALIGHWEFEETSGDTANDSSGTNNHGLVSFEFGGLGENFSVWLDDPVRGRVISFDGSIPGTYVEFALDTIPVMDFDNDFTWAFWALDLSSGPNHVILGNRYDGFGADFAPASSSSSPPHSSSSTTTPAAPTTSTTTTSPTASGTTTPSSKRAISSSTTSTASRQGPSSSPAPH